jgi:hypothetical protein
MQTLTHPLPAGTATAPREEAMKFYAAGRAAESLRALAANPAAVADTAAKSGATEDEARGLMLSLADGVAALEAAVS